MSLETRNIKALYDAARNRDKAKTETPKTAAAKPDTRDDYEKLGDAVNRIKETAKIHMGPVQEFLTDVEALQTEANELRKSDVYQFSYIRIDTKKFNKIKQDLQTRLNYFLMIFDNLKQDQVRGQSQNKGYEKDIRLMKGRLHEIQAQLDQLDFSAKEPTNIFQQTFDRMFNNQPKVEFAMTDTVNEVIVKKAEDTIAEIQRYLDSLQKTSSANQLDAISYTKIDGQMIIDQLKRYSPIIDNLIFVFDHLEKDAIRNLEANRPFSDRIQKVKGASHALRNLFNHAVVPRKLKPLTKTAA